MKTIIPLFIAAACWLQLPAQESVKSGLDISGYSRVTGFLGINSKTDPALNSLYHETSLKLKAKTGIWGQAYTDLRFRGGTEYGKEFASLNIREAYLDIFLGKADLRIGKQISPWGRADGWNPTDNLTPSDYFVRSPDPDDMRLGSYRIRARYNPMEWLRFELDLAPWYTPSVYRFDRIEMPDFVTIRAPVHPGFQWDKTSVGAKLDLIFQGIEGSVSWFKGYDALPGLVPGAMPSPPFTNLSLELLQVPFRQQTFGADLAAVILNTGIRAEFAYKIPDAVDSISPFIPKTDFQWVISVDRELGPLRVIAAYMGRYVPDFVPADPPRDFDPAMLSNPEVWPLLGSMLAGQVGYYNRILFDQTHPWSHSILIRPSVSLFHEILDLELAALYNITTGEYLLYPKVSWHPTDGLLFTAGYQYYEGDDYTRFSWIKNVFNGPFFEFRLSF